VFQLRFDCFKVVTRKLNGVFDAFSCKAASSLPGIEERLAQGDKKLLMYCTGGIRASAYFKHKVLKMYTNWRIGIIEYDKLRRRFTE
jgi:hypothetical protein